MPQCQMAAVAMIADFSYPENLGLFHECIMKNLFHFFLRPNCAHFNGVISCHEEIRQSTSLHAINYLLGIA